MKVLWSRGYGSTDAPHTIETGEYACSCCRLRGDGDQKPVAILDSSDGEYTSICLCHECLVDLANELLEIR